MCVVGGGGSCVCVCVFDCVCVTMYVCVNGCVGVWGVSVCFSLLDAMRKMLNEML